MPGPIDVSFIAAQESISELPAVKAPKPLAALLRIGWRIKRQGGTSYRILERPGWPDVLSAYHDKVTLGPYAMRVLASKTGLAPKDL